MNFRTIAQLPPVDDQSRLGGSSLLEVSLALAKISADSPQRYQSYSITTGMFSDYIKDLTLQQLSSNASGFGREHYQMWSWLEKIVENKPEDTAETYLNLSGKVNFTNGPKIDGALSGFTDEGVGKFAVNVDTMRNFMASNSPMFITQGASFGTSYFNVENNLTLYTEEAPSFNGEKHNEYLFRVSRTVSEPWEAPESGIFTCYGWLDEEVEGEPDNAKRWVALEGKVGSDEENNPWKILQLQPFIHNLYCSYVGFTFPVGKGMKLRIRTGFKVGTNSNKYQSTQGSLTNHIANAFVGGIYHVKDMNSAYDPTVTIPTREAPIQIEKMESANVKTLKEKVNEIIEALNSR